MRFTRPKTAAIVFIAVTLWVAGFLSPACRVWAATVDKTLAIVNNETIMLSEFDKISSGMMESFRSRGTELGEPEKGKIKKRILDDLIDKKLLAQEAKKQRIAVTKREIEQGIEQVKKRFRSEEDFQEELKSQGITSKAYEERIRQDIMVMRLIKNNVEAAVERPTEKEAAELFEKIKKADPEKTAKDDKATDEEKELAFIAKMLEREAQEKVQARHILLIVDKNAPQKEKLQTLTKIRDIRKRITDRKSFEEMARLYSEDPGTKSRGGDLGYFARGDMVPEFDKVAFSLEVGKVSDPVFTEFGYHLIYVEGKRAGRELSLEDVKNDMLDFLTQKKATKKYEEYLSALRKKANIRINSF